ncbi:hypothetical protein JTE90_021047 [Oedothorax gibbosus]|uniref:Mitochondrial proton/calcium exchanger protein n=1 Tax=Oedothorax gibbosus TaxID=931172 RepID=A0AAV6VQT7_9ARAC|nr:hypothetical protein JTE90_021047 [Oedothorax gibbosus]
MLFFYLIPSVEASKMQNKITPTWHFLRTTKLLKRVPSSPHPALLPAIYQHSPRSNPVFGYLSITGSPYSYTIASDIAPTQYRLFHSTRPIASAKEPSKIEETVEFLKEEKEEKSTTDPVPSPPNPKRSLGKRVWDEILHYYHGFRLLFIDVRVSSRLAWKILNGQELTRREHKQLVRTTSDLFRLVPFSIFIIVPFMELLLPVFLKFFPAMLPSTFTTKSESEKKFKAQLRIKIETAKFLQETLDEMAVSSKGETHSDTAKEFSQFFDRIRTTGAQATNKEILKFSKLFEDEITLDSLSRPQLIALCRLLELQPLGTNNFLRFQLRNRIRSLRADDRMILKEGIDSMTIQEIQAACRARGMRALGIPEDRLRSQLKQWLELSLLENIPSSLLLLSRCLYLPESVPTTDLLKVTLSSLSDSAATETKYKIGEMEGKVDNKTKLELIRLEEEQIRKDAEELKQQQVNEQKEEKHKEEKEASKKDIIADTLDKETLVDKAKVLEDKAEILEKPSPESKEGELTKEDFDDLENALENIASEKNKLLIEKEELEDLKEEMAEYKQDVEELKDTVSETGNKEIRESKAAKRLSNKVNKMISKMDVLVNNLNKEKDQIQQQIDEKEKEGVSIGKERDDIVSVSELVLALRNIQKVSDDTKLKRITDVLAKMDVDRDGAVEVDHVLKVIELLGNDNVKVTQKQMDDIIELLMKEDTLETEDKLQKQKQLEKDSSSDTSSSSSDTSSSSDADEQPKK